ncbi:hypothetical protein RSPO_c00180 [Ralstonia solanacearum Po82]|uniref:Uncharacterized protein n=1 Tax=Ralstonia solanacearum (strain Po82) TaxID=1031711 RepID=F6G6D9_RALS8|nr:hypothetical protein RSPO_c00180 [Ralstonia solanacearum Po82]EUJ16360.1 hypothetical protein RSP673_00830 [Ralstonia solanacearum P673]
MAQMRASDVNDTSAPAPIAAARMWPPNDVAMRFSAAVLASGLLRHNISFDTLRSQSTD